MKTKPQSLDLEGIKKNIIDRVYKETIYENGKKFYKSKKEIPDPIIIALDICFDEIKQRLKSACEFYLRYKDKPELLEKENHKLWVKISNENRITTGKVTDQYNEWLFKLAFKDVLEEEK